MKPKAKKSITLSDKIADVLTLKPRADIEDDHVFGTKPQTVSRADLGSSDSDDEGVISDFRKRNVNLLSEVSKKYQGQVVSRGELESDNESFEDSSQENDPQKKIISKPSQSSDQLDSDNDTQDKVALYSKEQSEAEDLESDIESDDYSITKLQKQLGSDKQESDDGEGESASGDDDEDAGYDISQINEPIKEDFEHVKKQNISEDAKKGICVRNQLLVWENLLEMRIHLQRCINTANQMPFPETFKDLQRNEEFSKESNNTKEKISSLLDKLLLLQNMLLRNYPETKSLATLKKGQLEQKQENKKPIEASDEEIPSDTDNEEIPSDTDEENNTKIKAKNINIGTSEKFKVGKKRKLEDYENELASSFKAFKSFRDTTIQKWDDKTRLARAANIKNAPTNTILQQIAYILSDRDKLVKRTQLKRSEYDIIGYKKQETQDNGNKDNLVTKDRKDDDEYIPEIFDDSDFYHQLLRELIECKSADISDPVQLSRQWIALQQMRSKMKRKVDTKATKGRKIKYVVHNQLVNFMAPEKSSKWSDEATNELFNSLFGKMFEHNNAGVENLGNVFKIQK